MRGKMHTEISPCFAVQHGKELVSLKVTKIQITDLYPEVGMTDWEIHLNKTMHFREEDTTQATKKPEMFTKKTTSAGEFNLTNQNSDYWIF